MRASREAMAQNRNNILAAAVRMLRRRGIERTNVSDLMQSVGMTHGGFYKHFASKEALISESAQKIYDDILTKYEALAEAEGGRAALAAYVDFYLSKQHVDHPEDGCLLVAIGSEVARDNAALRGIMTSGSRRLRKFIEAGLVCPQPQRRERATELIALMVGAVATARLSSDAKFSKEILESSRRRAAALTNRRNLTKFALRG